MNLLELENFNGVCRCNNYVKINKPKHKNVINYTR